MQTTALVLLASLLAPAHAFTNFPLAPRTNVALNVKQNAFERDLRFKGAVNFRPVQETSYFEGSELSTDKKVRAQQLVEAAVNVAKKRDAHQVRV